MTLLKPNAPYCFFEDGKTARLFTHSNRWVTADKTADIPIALRQIEAATEEGAHAAGYVAYEAASAFEALPTDGTTPSAPLLCFGLFAAPQVLSGPALDLFWQQKVLESPSCSNLQITPHWDETTYARALEEVHERLAAGDIYQANITFPLDLKLYGSAEAFYARLRRNQPAAYSAFMALPDRVILSLSPERFFTVTGDKIETQPMKGTAPIDLPGAQDALRKDPKNRAENLMITDLLRNDLSRIAAKSSVQVPALFDVERLPSLYQMTSKVTAQLPPGTRLTDLFSALFPCGSVTGAPKRSAMSVIKHLETQPRGPYCGAIGMVAPDGDMTFSVPIRTIVQQGETVQMSIGSGIVADSDTASEYKECLLKAAFLTAQRPNFSLIETMAFPADAPSMPAYWKHHKARLAAAIAYFGFAPLKDGFDDEMAFWLAGLPDGAHKIRLVYARHGALSLTASPMPGPATKPMIIRLGHLTGSTEAAFLRHKTTYRAAYTAALASARSAGPCDEVFLTEGGALTEGSYTNIFLRKEGALLTPRATGRFLPGVLRTHLLETGDAEEADLSTADLQSADMIYAGNALRGLVPATVLFGDSK